MPELVHPEEEKQKLSDFVRVSHNPEEEEFVIESREEVGRGKKFSEDLTMDEDEAMKAAVYFLNHLT